MVYILKIFLTLTDTDIIDGEKFNTDGELFNPSILEQKDASGGDHEIVIKEPIIKSLTFAEKDKGLTFLRNKKNKRNLAKKFPQYEKPEKHFRNIIFHIKKNPEYNTQEVKKLYKFIADCNKKPFKLFKNEITSLYEAINQKLEKIFKKGTKISPDYLVDKSALIVVCSYEWEHRDPPENMHADCESYKKNNCTWNICLEKKASDKHIESEDKWNKINQLKSKPEYQFDIASNIDASLNEWEEYLDELAKNIPEIKKINKMWKENKFKTHKERKVLKLIITRIIDTYKIQADLLRIVNQETEKKNIANEARKYIAQSRSFTYDINKKLMDQVYFFNLSCYDKDFKNKLIIFETKMKKYTKEEKNSFNFATKQTCQKQKVYCEAAFKANLDAAENRVENQYRWREIYIKNILNISKFKQKILRIFIHGSFKEYSIITEDEYYKELDKLDNKYQKINKKYDEGKNKKFTKKDREDGINRLIEKEWVMNINNQRYMDKQRVFIDQLPPINENWKKNCPERKLQEKTKWKYPTEFIEENKRRQILDSLDSPLISDDRNKMEALFVSFLEDLLYDKPDMKLDEAILRFENADDEFLLEPITYKFYKQIKLYENNISIEEATLKIFQNLLNEFIEKNGDNQEKMWPGPEDLKPFFGGYKMKFPVNHAPEALDEIFENNEEKENFIKAHKETFKEAQKYWKKKMNLSISYELDNGNSTADLSDCFAGQYGGAPKKQAGGQNTATSAPLRGKPCPGGSTPDVSLKSGCKPAPTSSSSPVSSPSCCKDCPDEITSSAIAESHCIPRVEKNVEADHKNAKRKYEKAVADKLDEKELAVLRKKAEELATKLETQKKAEEEAKKECEACKNWVENLPYPSTETRGIKLKPNLKGFIDKILKDKEKKIKKKYEMEKYHMKSKKIRKLEEKKSEIEETIETLRTRLRYLNEWDRDDPHGLGVNIKKQIKDEEIALEKVERDADEAQNAEKTDEEKKLEKVCDNKIKDLKDKFSVLKYCMKYKKFFEEAQRRAMVPKTPKPKDKNKRWWGFWSKPLKKTPPPPPPPVSPPPKEEIEMPKDPLPEQIHQATQEAADGGNVEKYLRLETKSAELLKKVAERSQLSLDQKGSKQAAKKGAKQAAKKGAKQAAKKGGGKHDLQQEALQNAMKNAMDKDSPPHDMNDLKEEMEHKIEQKKAELEELIYQKKTHEHKLAEILQKLDKRKKDTKIKTDAFKQIAKQAASTAKIKKEAATAVLQHPSAHMTQGNVISANEKIKHYKEAKANNEGMQQLKTEAETTTAIDQMGDKVYETNLDKEKALLEEVTKKLKKGEEELKELEIKTDKMKKDIEKAEKEADFTVSYIYGKTLTPGDVFPTEYEKEEDIGQLEKFGVKTDLTRKPIEISVKLNIFKDCSLENRLKEKCEQNKKHLYEAVFGKANKDNSCEEMKMPSYMRKINLPKMAKDDGDRGMPAKEQEKFEPHIIFKTNWTEQPSSTEKQFIGEKKYAPNQKWLKGMKKSQMEFWEETKKQKSTIPFAVTEIPDQWTQTGGNVISEKEMAATTPVVAPFTENIKKCEIQNKILTEAHQAMEQMKTHVFFEYLVHKPKITKEDAILKFERANERFEQLSIKGKPKNLKDFAKQVGTKSFKGYIDAYKKSWERANEMIKHDKLNTLQLAGHRNTVPSKEYKKFMEIQHTQNQIKSDWIALENILWEKHDHGIVYFFNPETLKREWDHLKIPRAHKHFGGTKRKLRKKRNKTIKLKKFRGGAPSP